MSPFAPLFSFLMALFGISFVAASALTSATTSSTASSTPVTADSPPAVITFSAYSISELHPSVIYAGLPAAIAITVTDDNALTSVEVQTPGMRAGYGGYVFQTVSFTCGGLKTCSDPGYTIVPDKPGIYTLTMTAKDNAGQITIRTIMFTALGCATDSECGSNSFPAGGTTYCGPAGASVQDKRIQSGTLAVCVDSSCNEKWAPGVLEDCALAGKICDYLPTDNTQSQCVSKPSNSSSSVPGAGAPEPSNNDVGAWAAVDIATGQIENVVVCTRPVCGLNGEYHGYVPPPTYPTGSVWWPTSKRYIWQIPGQAGYSSGTFNFNTYIFTVPGGTIYNGKFTPTPAPAPAIATPTSTLTAPNPAPTVYTPLPSAAAPTSTPAQPAPIAQCLQAGGVWCYTESSQSNIGYCATAKSGCERKPETSQTEERRAELQSQEQFFAERRAILQDLRAMERLVKQDVVDVDAKLLKAYKEKLLALKPGEEQDLSVLQNYREKITELRGDEESIAVAPSFADPRAEAKALKQMKQGLRPFERYLATIEAKVATVEKAGIAVDASIKETITAAKTMAKRVKDAKTYTSVRDIVDAMPDIGQALNDALPRLEERLRLPRVFSVLGKKIVEAEGAITQTRAVAKKLKLDADDNIAEMQTLLTEAKEAIAAVKADAAATDDLAFMLEETVVEKVDGIFDLAAHIKTVGSIRQAVNRAAADAKRYESHIRRLKKAKGDTQIAAATAFLKQFNEYQNTLKDLSKQKLTPEVGDQIIEQVRAMADTRDDLDNILNLSKPDPLETEIRQLFSASGEKLTPFDVEKLEQGVL